MSKLSKTNHEPMSADAVNQKGGVDGHTLSDFIASVSHRRVRSQELEHEAYVPASQPSPNNETCQHCGEVKRFTVFCSVTGQQHCPVTPAKGNKPNSSNRNSWNSHADPVTPSGPHSRDDSIEDDPFYEGCAVSPTRYAPASSKKDEKKDKKDKKDKKEDEKRPTADPFEEEASASGERRGSKWTIFKSKEEKDQEKLREEEKKARQEIKETWKKETKNSEAFKGLVKLNAKAKKSLEGLYMAIIDLGKEEKKAREKEEEVWKKECKMMEKSIGNALGAMKKIETDRQKKEKEEAKKDTKEDGEASEEEEAGNSERGGEDGEEKQDVPDPTADEAPVEQPSEEVAPTESQVPAEQ